MEAFIQAHGSSSARQTPRCEVFGQCGGCLFQDISYEDELYLKGVYLKQLLSSSLDIPDSSVQPVVRSPEEYHARSRLDLSLKRTKSAGIIMGFTEAGRRRLIPITACPIAREEISGYLPRLRDEAIQKLPEKYRTANLVIKTGDDGRVLWGGIGRRSLELKPSDYLWTEIRGKRIHYSLSTFFQANLSILPAVISEIIVQGDIRKDTLFLDLYAGVGLFGLCIAEHAGKTLMVEENASSVRLAQYNIEFNKLRGVEIIAGMVEEQLSQVQQQTHFARTVAMIDPPRKGLSEPVAHALARANHLNALFYLSCHPESLVRDLAIFLKEGWSVERIVPFDFFPRTKHLETLVLLRPGKAK